MRKSLYLMLTVWVGFGCTSILATGIKCQMDNAILGGDKIDVPANSLQINFEGNVVSAFFFPGDRHEPQTYLQMTFNGFTSTNYNVSEQTIYVLENGNYRLQCGFEQT